MSALYRCCSGVPTAITRNGPWSRPGSPRAVQLGVRILLLLLLALLGAACGPEAPPRPLSGYQYQERDGRAAARPMPWESWPLFKDLQGRKLSNRSIILGDELVGADRRRAALDAYLRAAKGDALLPREAEAVTARLASQYLVLDEPAHALSTISEYFKRRGLSEAQVKAPFSVLLAFGYGRRGEIDQSLAWFSRAYREPQAQAPLRDVARRGVRFLLQSIESAQFEQVAATWSSDQFVHEQLGRERLARLKRGSDPERAQRPFWLAFWDAEVDLRAPSGGDAPAPAGAPVVGVVLSLSDKFGALGRDTRQGFEVAMEADPERPKLKVEVRDAGADGVAAAAAVRELIAGPKVSVIVGPLLNDAAVAAAAVASEERVPLVALSKSEGYRAPPGTFRIGATSSSQIEALIAVAQGEYQLSRFAVAYPQSAAGLEYVQVLRRALGARNLTLVSEIAYPSGDDAALAQVARQLEQTSADAFLIADGIEASARLLSAITPAERRRMRPLGTALWDNVTRIANSQALFQGALFVTPFFAASSRPVVQQFVQSYRTKFQSAPNFLAAQGFDVGTLVRTALRTSQREGRPFSEAFAHLPPYDGVTGSISVDPAGGVRRSFSVVEVGAEQFYEKLSAR